MNEKIIYRTIEKLVTFLGIDIYHERIKELVLGGDNPLTESERKVNYYADAMRYIYNHRENEISKYFLLRLYFLLSNRVLEENVVEEIMHINYLTMDSEELVRASELMHYICNLKIVENFSFGYLIAVFVMNKYDTMSMEIKENLHDILKESIRSPSRDSLLQYLISTSKIHKEIPGINNKKEVIKSLLLIKDEIKEKYGIKAMILYGSIVNGTYRKDSDVDLIVELETKDKIRIKEIKEELRLDLKNRLMVRVDVVLMQDAIRNFKNLSLKGSKRII